MEESKKSNIAGFLDGYKAGNVASFSSNFNSRKVDIDHLIQLIFDEIAQDSNAETKIFKTALTSIKTLFKESKSTPDDLLAFGRLLKGLIISFKKLPVTDERISSYIKKIIYHFLDLSKSSNDGILMDMAIEIGELY